MIVFNVVVLVLLSLHAHTRMTKAHLHNPHTYSYPKQCWIARYKQKASHNIDSHGAWHLHHFFYLVLRHYCTPSNNLTPSCPNASGGSLMQLTLINVLKLSYVTKLTLAVYKRTLGAEGTCTSGGSHHHWACRAEASHFPDRCAWRSHAAGCAKCRSKHWRCAQ